MTDSINDLSLKLNSKQESLKNEYVDYEYLLRQMLRREKLVSKIAQKVRQSLKLEKVLQTTVEEVRHLLKTDRVVLYDFAADWSGSVVVESVSPDWMCILGKEIQDTCFEKDYALLYQDGRVRVINDIYLAGLAHCHVQLLAELQVRANLVIPIIRQDFLWGLLIAHHCQGPREWEDSDIELLKQLSVQLAIAIQQAHLYEQLEAELAKQSSTSADKQDSTAQTALQELKILLQREDISWDNIIDVVKQTLAEALQGKITWKRE